MKFAQSGLNNHPLLEQAFAASYVKATQGEALDTAVQKIKQNMEDWYNGALQHYQNISYDRAELANAKGKLDYEYGGYLDQADALAKEILEDNFSILHLRPARAIQDYAENTPPHVLAAALLLPGVKSDDDLKKISADFGAETGDLVRALYQIKDDAVNAGYELDSLATASDEVKTVYLARRTVILQHEVEGTKDTMRYDSRAEIAALEKSREENLYGIANALAQVNPEMDRHFRDAFNELASLTSSEQRLSTNYGGDLRLVPADKMVLQEVKTKEKPDRDPPIVIVL